LEKYNDDQWTKYQHEQAGDGSSPDKKRCNGEDDKKKQPASHRSPTRASDRIPSYRFESMPRRAFPHATPPATDCCWFATTGSWRTGRTQTTETAPSLLSAAWTACWTAAKFDLGFAELFVHQVHKFVENARQ
jgi:hypothetical protein